MWSCGSWRGSTTVPWTAASWSSSPMVARWVCAPLTSVLILYLGESRHKVLCCSAFPEVGGLWSGVVSF